MVTRRSIALQGHTRNVKKREGRKLFIKQREAARQPGQYPDPTHDNSYIHSTYRGFRADYNQLTAKEHLEDVLSRSVDSIYHTNQERIKRLRSTGRKYKVQYFGCKSEDDDIEQSPALTLLFKKDKLVQELQTLQTQLSWSIIHDTSNVIGQLNKEYLRAKKQDPTSEDALEKKIIFYKTWSQQWIDQINQVLATLGTPQYQNQFNDLQNLLTEFRNNIQTDGSGIIINKKGMKLGEVLSKLGFQWEAVSAWILTNALKTVANPKRVQRHIHQLKQEGVKDLLMGKLVYDDSIPIDLQLQGGISAKFRSNENFSITAAVNPATILNEYTDKATDFLNCIGYLYNNWISLASFSGEEDADRAKLRTSFRKQRRNKLTLRGLAEDNNSVNVPILARMFFPLTQYVNLYMLNLGFYGNRKDVGDIPPFNPNFLQGLDQLTQIPVFLLTKTHCHETADVFEFYNNSVYGGDLLISIADLFTGNRQSEGIFLPTKRPAPTILRAAYRQKRTLLREDTTQDIYSVIGSVRPSDTTDYFSLLMENTKSRHLNIRFKLLDSYRGLAG